MQFRLQNWHRTQLLLLAGGLSVVLLITTFLVYRYIQLREIRSLYVRDEEQLAASPVPVAPLSSAIHVPILMYHYVEHVTDLKDTVRQSLAISPAVLENQIKTLKENGYTFLFASDLGEILDGKKALPTKPIVLTFDDGYRDFYTDVFPILKKYQVKATAYIISGFIGKPNYMFLPQLQEVAGSGLVEIGAHTQHHVNLKIATAKRAETEIVQSKTDLEKLFNRPVVSFAYPGGRFNDQAIQIVKDAGFTTAVSTMPGTSASVQNRFTLLRLRPGARTGKVLIQKI